MSALVLVFLIACLVIGVPIAFALTASAGIGLYMLTGNVSQLLTIAGTSIYSSVADYTLTSVPMFILMAYVTSQTGIAKDLFDAASKWLSAVRGGLAMATLVATAIFGAMSGASVAAAAVMSEIAVPQMRRARYSEELATGVVAVGSTTNILIPPSIALIIYGLLTDTSIGALLVAGLVPGILLAIVLAIVIYVWVTFDPSIAPPTEKVGMDEKLRSLVVVWPSVLLIAAVMFLLYTGIATPTEVGAVGALAATLLGFVLKRLTWRGALEALRMTVRRQNIWR